MQPDNNLKRSARRSISTLATHISKVEKLNRESVVKELGVGPTGKKISRARKEEFAPSARYGLRAARQKIGSAAPRVANNVPPAPNYIPPSPGYIPPPPDDEATGTGPVQWLQDVGTRFSRQLSRKKDKSGAPDKEPLMLKSAQVAVKKTLASDTAKTTFNSAWGLDQLPRVVPSNAMADMSGVWPFTVVAIVCALLDRHATLVDGNAGRKGYKEARGLWEVQLGRIKVRQETLVGLYESRLPKPPESAGSDAHAKWQQTEDDIAVVEDQVEAELLALTVTEMAMASFEDQWCRPSELQAVRLYRTPHSEALAAQARYVKAVAAACTGEPIGNDVRDRLDALRAEAERLFDVAPPAANRPKVGLFWKGGKKHYHDILDEYEKTVHANEKELEARVSAAAQEQDPKLRNERQKELEKERKKIDDELTKIGKLRGEIDEGRGAYELLKTLPPSATKEVRDSPVQLMSVTVNSIGAGNGLTALILAQEFAQFIDAASTTFGVVGGSVPIVNVIPQLLTAFLDRRDAKADHDKNSRAVAGQLSGMYYVAELVLDHGEELGPAASIIAPYFNMKVRLAYWGKQGINQSVNKYIKSVVSSSAGVGAGLGAGISVIVLTTLGATIGTYGFASLAYVPVACYMAYYYGGLGGRALLRKLLAGDVKAGLATAIAVTESLGEDGLRTLLLRKALPPGAERFHQMVMPRPLSKDKDVLEKMERRLAILRLQKNPHLWVNWLELNLQDHALHGLDGRACEAEFILGTFFKMPKEKINQLLAQYTKCATLKEASENVKDTLAPLFGAKLYTERRLNMVEDTKTTGEVAAQIDKLLDDDFNRRNEAVARQKAELASRQEKEIDEAVRKAAKEGRSEPELAALRQRLDDEATREFNAQTKVLEMRSRFLERSLDYLQRVEWQDFADSLPEEERTELMYAMEDLRRYGFQKYGITDSNLRDLFDDLVMERPLYIQGPEAKIPVSLRNRVGPELVELLRKPLRLQPVSRQQEDRPDMLRPTGSFPLDLSHLKLVLREEGKARRRAGVENKHVKRLVDMQPNTLSDPVKAAAAIEGGDTALVRGVWQRLIDKLPAGEDGRKIPAEYGGLVNAYMKDILKRMVDVATATIELMDADQTSGKKYSHPKLFGLRSVALALQVYQPLAPDLVETGPPYKIEEPEETLLMGDVPLLSVEPAVLGRRLDTLLRKDGEEDQDPAKVDRRWNWEMRQPDWSRIKPAAEMRVRSKSDTRGAVPEALAKFESLPEWETWQIMRKLPGWVVWERVYAAEPVGPKAARVWLLDNPDGTFWNLDMETGLFQKAEAESLVRTEDLVVPEGTFINTGKFEWVARTPDQIEQERKRLLEDYTRPRPGPGQSSLGTVLRTPEAEAKAQVMDALSEQYGIDPDRVDWTTATRSGRRIRFAMKDSTEFRTLNLRGPAVSNTLRDAGKSPDGFDGDDPDRGGASAFLQLRRARAGGKRISLAQPVQPLSPTGSGAVRDVSSGTVSTGATSAGTTTRAVPGPLTRRSSAKDKRKSRLVASGGLAGNVVQPAKPEAPRPERKPAPLIDTEKFAAVLPSGMDLNDVDLSSVRPKGNRLSFSLKNATDTLEVEVPTTGTAHGSRPERTRSSRSSSSSSRASMVLRPRDLDSLPFLTPDDSSDRMPTKAARADIWNVTPSSELKKPDIVLKDPGKAASGRDRSVTRTKSGEFRKSRIVKQTVDSEPLSPPRSGKPVLPVTPRDFARPVGPKAQPWRPSEAERIAKEEIRDALLIDRDFKFNPDDIVWSTLTKTGDDIQFNLVDSPAQYSFNLVTRKHGPTNFRDAAPRSTAYPRPVASTKSPSTTTVLPLGKPVRNLFRDDDDPPPRHSQPRDGDESRTRLLDQPSSPVQPAGPGYPSGMDADVGPVPARAKPPQRITPPVSPQTGGDNVLPTWPASPGSSSLLAPQDTELRRRHRRGGTGSEETLLGLTQEAPVLITDQQENPDDIQVTMRRNMQEREKLQKQRELKKQPAGTFSRQDRSFSRRPERKDPDKKL